MRSNSEVALPVNATTEYERDLNYKLKEIFRSVISRVNYLSDGRVSAIDNAASSIPTVGMFAQGDVVRNKVPTELGSAGSKYVITGWICVAGGNPGTFVAMRSLTGN